MRTKTNRDHVGCMGGGQSLLREHPVIVAEDRYESRTAGGIFEFPIEATKSQ